MTLRQLRIFTVVYRTENITKAAEEMNMTQPAVTRALRELEEHYSVQLFSRIRRRLYVTEAGRRLYPQAVHILASMERMEKDMAGREEGGVLRVGAGTTLGCVLLPALLSEFGRTHPAFTVRSTVTDTADLCGMLLHGEIDFALIEGASEDRAFDRAFLGKDRMVLILPRSHPLCGRGDITVRDLAGHDIIVSESGSASRDFLEHLFSIHGLKLDPVMESGSMPAILQAVRAGIGIALMPQRIVSLFGREEDLEERELSYEVLTRENHIVWLKNRYLGRASLDLIGTATACAARVLSR